MNQPIISVLPKYKNKQEIAFEEIKNAIIQCRFQQGDTLVIRTLAAQLGISEIPVREALKRLISESFVVEGSSACHVAPVSASEFLDMLEVQLDLEIVAIKLAARKITEEQVQFLKGILDAMETCCTEQDMKSYLKEHFRFHLECCKICNVSYLANAIAVAVDHHRRGLNYFHLSTWEVKPSIQEHVDILNALAAHNPEAAQKAHYQNKKQANELYRKQMMRIMN